MAFQHENLYTILFFTYTCVIFTKKVKGKKEKSFQNILSKMRPFFNVGNSH